MLDLYTLPSIPYDFAGSGAADALFGLFRAVSDVEPNAVLKALLKPVRVSLDEISDFWQTIPATSRLAGMSDLPAGPELDAANVFFRRLVCLHGRAALLADMYRGVGFSHAKVATGFLQILNTPEETTLLKDLGKFHRACTWENILIKSAIPQAVVSIIEGKTPGPRAVARGTVQTAAGVPEDVLSELATVLPDGGGQDNLPAVESVRTRNGKAFKYLVSQCPASLTPFFQGPFGLQKSVWPGFTLSLTASSPHVLRLSHSQIPHVQAWDGCEPQEDCGQGGRDHLGHHGRPPPMGTGRSVHPLLWAVRRHRADFVCIVPSPSSA